MAELTAAERKKIPGKKFGLPGQRKYPMPDKSHAANAKARAKQQLDKGNIDQAEYKKIVAMADKMLGSSGEDSAEDRTDLYVRTMPGRRRMREND